MKTPFTHDGLIERGFEETPYGLRKWLGDRQVGNTLHLWMNMGELQIADGHSIVHTTITTLEELDQFLSYINFKGN